MRKISPEESKVLDYLREHGASTRKELVKGLNMPRTSVYNALKPLLDHRSVRKGHRYTNKRGRPMTTFFPG